MYSFRVVNNLVHSLFSTVRLAINDQELHKNPSLYPYKAYLSNLLSYSTNVKTAQLQASGWYTGE